jgi:exopolysaccharide biosynthesis protein
MVELGVWDAVNLDGGGSTTLVYRRADGSWWNSRGRGFERPVAVQLGFRNKWGTRVVRGAER